MSSTLPAKPRPAPVRIRPGPRPKKLAENVAASILNFITSESLAPGTILAPEHELIESLDVGRWSLREALRFLEMHGIVDVRAGRNGGAIVGTPSGANFAQMSGMYFHAMGISVRELMDARLVLEPAMVAALTTRADVAPFEERMRAYRVTDARDPANQPVDDFHWAIADLSGNGVLQLVAQAMRDLYAGAAKEVVLSAEEAQRIEQVHSDIAEAVLRRDAIAAEDLMASHIQDVLEVLETRYPHILLRRITWP